MKVVYPDFNHLSKGEDEEMRTKYNYHQDKGQCFNCGKSNHTSIWKVFEQDGWFRGDDIYLGKFCKICKNARAYVDNNLTTKK